MFKVNNKNIWTRSMTSFWCFYFWLLTYFTPFSSAFIVNFEQLNVNWVVISNSGIWWRILTTMLSMSGTWTCTQWYPTENIIINLTQLRPMVHSYRNRSMDFHCKSIDWFLFVSLCLIINLANLRHFLLVFKT